MVQKKREKMDERIEQFVIGQMEEYDNMKKMVEELKEEIITEPPMAIGEQDRVTGGPISDPTFKKCLRLVSCETLKSMEKSITAVERALARLEKEHRDIFDLRYRKGWEWVKVTQEMHISKASAHRKQRELINEVADQLGLYEYQVYRKAGNL